ncbi:MAG: glutamate-1-semialdehyde 2,1-aminomutase [Planctomycetota bacterium]|jgi:glutamate-1-semialdehyde 2,1-aminomutase
MKRDKSRKVMEQAARWIPGGVNSPVRAFGSVGGNPPVIQSGKGAILTDIDGNEYIDLVGSWGPLILGHGHPAVIEAVRDALDRGTSFGAPTEMEAELARLIVEIVPSVDRVRLVNSGTEAAMSAVRLARGCTRRDGIIKFSGCYHGHSDSFLIQAGSGAMTLGVPSSPGVTEGAARDTYLARYNDLDSVNRIFKENPERVATVIVEPVAGNMGCIPPAPGFLEGLRSTCDREGSLLIFDEVITGFRVALGGAQDRYNVTPDLSVFGKIIGGGLPVGAYGGSEQIMSHIAPEGPVYQAGTLSGNPLAVAAGFAALNVLKEEDPYNRLEAMGACLEEGFRTNLERLGLELFCTRVGSMSCLFFDNGPVKDFLSALESDTIRFANYFRSMLEQGIYIAPSQFETAFLSTAHTDEMVDRIVEANFNALEKAYD